MKRILIFAFAIAASTGAFAQLYKWVDKNGRVTYSDQPPPAQESKQLNIGAGASPVPRSAPRSSATRNWKRTARTRRRSRRPPMNSRRRRRSSRKTAIARRPTYAP